MFCHFAHLHNRFCPIPICPSQIGRKVEQQRSKLTQPKSASIWTTPYLCKFPFSNCGISITEQLLKQLGNPDLYKGGSVVADVDGADEGGPLQLQHGRDLLLAGAPAPPLFALIDIEVIGFCFISRTKCKQSTRSETEINGSALSFLKEGP